MTETIIEAKTGPLPHPREVASSNTYDKLYSAVEEALKVIAKDPKGAEKILREASGIEPVGGEGAGRPSE